MESTIKRALRVTFGLALFSSLGASGLVAGVEEMRREVQAMREAEVAWRHIPWRTCLVQGLREWKAESKPVVLWMFIDRPIDDKRC